MARKGGGGKVAAGRPGGRGRRLTRRRPPVCVCLPAEDEMFSDIYKIREVANGLCLEVEGKVSDSPAPREGWGGDRPRCGDSGPGRCLEPGLPGWWRRQGLGRGGWIPCEGPQRGTPTTAWCLWPGQGRLLPQAVWERARGRQAGVQRWWCNETLVRHWERSLA